jgi:hypothetical protein
MPVNADVYINDIIITGITTLIVCRVAKGIGQKDISEIVVGSGWCILGVNIAGLIKMTISRVSETVSGISDFFTKIDTFIEGLPLIGLGN